MHLGQQCEQGLPERRWDFMQATVEAAFGEHRLDVAVVSEEHAAVLLVARKQGRGNKSDGHDLRGRQLGLRGVLVASGRKKIVAQAVNRDDLSDRMGHGRSPEKCWVGLSLYGNRPGI